MHQGARIIGWTSALAAAFSARRQFDQDCPDVAQLVEQLIRNQQVGGSSPPVGSSNSAHLRRLSPPPGRPARLPDSSKTAAGAERGLPSGRLSAPPHLRDVVFL